MSIYCQTGHAPTFRSSGLVNIAFNWTFPLLVRYLVYLTNQQTFIHLLVRQLLSMTQLLLFPFELLFHTFASQVLTFAIPGQIN